MELLEREHGPRRWRSGRPGIDGLVRTILSQNTNDKNSGAAFERLRQTFASWDAVRRAPVHRIARAIRVAGISKVKAARIRRALEQIHTDRGDLSLEFLRSLEPAKAGDYLGQLEGVGPKTVACVLMFCFGMPVLPVDTHVHRVSLRLGLLGPGTGAARAHELLGAVVPPELVYPFHVLLIQHGRKVCRSRSPDCERCVLRRSCTFFKEGQQPISTATLQPPGDPAQVE